MKNTTYTIFLKIILLLIFTAVIVFIVKNTNFNQLYTQSQIPFFLFLNNFFTTLPANFWHNLTLLGDGFVLIPLFAPLLLLNTKVWASIIASIPAASILSVLGKNIFTMPRPASILEHDSFTIIGNAITAHTSLPSGHTITVFTLFGVLIISIYNSYPAIKNKFLWIFSLLCIASLLALSRVAVGAHWPIDLVVGGFMGVMAAKNGIYLTNKYKKWWAWMRHTNNFLILAILLFIWSIALFLRVDDYYTSFSIALSSLTSFIIATYLIQLWIFRND